MRNRVLIPERMDDPALDPDEHRRALRGLQRINAWTGNPALIQKYVWKAACERGARPLRVLDIATGAADLPIQLVRVSPRRQVARDIEMHACDVSDQALAVARQNCSAADADVRLFRLDVVNEDIPERYDVVICSQFLHHLSRPDAELVLHKMKAAATRVIIVDLERSRVNWLQVWLATRVLTSSKVVHFDGPQSIRAAFTVAEFESLVRPVGFASYEIHRHWPCRFVFIGDTDGTA
ncbi:MAG: methyltransferase domain-containing protein [Pirellulaceae bacterium]